MAEQQTGTGIDEIRRLGNEFVDQGKLNDFSV